MWSIVCMVLCIKIRHRSNQPHEIQMMIDFCSLIGLYPRRLSCSRLRQLSIIISKQIIKKVIELYFTYLLTKFSFLSVIFIVIFIHN